MSGGEQQRVAIARAVITRPALLLADEPTGNLDDGQAERLMQLFKEMNRIGTTVIVATHNEMLVERHPAADAAHRQRPSRRQRRGRLVAGSGGRPDRDGWRCRDLCCGPAGFDELGLRRALSDRMVPLLVAAMAFLAALALAGWFGSAALSQHWQQGAGASLTVQVPQATDPAAHGGQTRLAAVLAALTGTPGVASAHALTDQELADLLKPWLGQGADRLAIPIPAVIAVRLTNTEADLAPLTRRLTDAAPGTLVEDHGLWIGRLAVLAKSLQACAGLALLLVAGVAASVIAVATRAGLSTRRQAIEIVHGLGATDSYIAGRFAARATMLAAAWGRRWRGAWPCRSCWRSRGWPRRSWAETGGTQRRHDCPMRWARLPMALWLWRCPACRWAPARSASPPPRARFAAGCGGCREAPIDMKRRSYHGAPGIGRGPSSIGVACWGWRPSFWFVDVIRRPAAPRAAAHGRGSSALTRAGPDGCRSWRCACWRAAEPTNCYSAASAEAPISAR